MCRFMNWVLAYCQGNMCSREQMCFFARKKKPTTGVIAGTREAGMVFHQRALLGDRRIAKRPLACASARIMAFVGGPSTEGPCSIVSKSLSEPICSHKDLDKDSAPLYDKAVKFYDQIAKQLVHQGHILDLFACAVDQVGVAEMKVANLQLRRLEELLCLQKKSPLSSDTVIGQGNTSAWKMCGLDKKTSPCLVYDIAKKDGSNSIGQAASNQFYFQFLTYYQHHDGQMRIRATTFSRRWASGSDSAQELIASFDQEAAAVVMEHLVSFKMETEADFDPIRWLD
ncbi:hypothetical protein GUJ93_ZPchr0002g23602 [Zizania palustris]|uniref:Protein transport protein SEC23 n=1 Tax=Zizania palustris TaxID=103762 RepID=A0A8J5RZA7_ZIZPA|nr:hypothetical protein GUJ93_ZPchr0002g23602 [Zizania palustris]